MSVLNAYGAILQVANDEGEFVTIAPTDIPAILGLDDSPLVWDVDPVDAPEVAETPDHPLPDEHLMCCQLGWLTHHAWLQHMRECHRH